MTSTRSLKILLEGRVQDVESATQGLVEILRHLARADPTFLERLAARAKGRLRQPVARSREALYPRRRDLARRSVQVVEGWFLATNISNREKRIIIERACNIAN